MTEAEEKIWKKIWKESNNQGFNLNETDAHNIFLSIKPLIDEQVKKDLSRFLRWLDKRYGTPNPNPQLYDLDIKNFLNEKP